MLHRLFAVLGATGTWSQGDGFISGAGFYTGLTSLQIEALATDTGYRIVLNERWPYPHALLAPEEAKRSRPTDLFREDLSQV